jgi:hypothetical protein
VTTNPLGLKTAVAYNPLEQVTSTTEPISGASTSAQFDTRNNQVGTTNQLADTSG